MKRTSVLLIVCLLAIGFTALAQADEGENHLQSAGINSRDIAAVQRGAKLFVNYCLGCHSANYMRYHRLVNDLGLTKEMVMKNLVFSGAKIGDPMTIAMDPEQAKKWFGKTPPDLSVIARARSNDWLFSYLKSFYQDKEGGWNNLILPNAAMPNVLWRLQGIQTPVYVTRNDEKKVDHLVLAKPGLQSPEEYDQTARDLVSFLDYLSEPSKLRRKSLGIWVMLFLVVFAALAYALKAEYWRDVH